MRPLTATINLKKIAQNLDAQRISNNKIMAVIKANAYGHGACKVAKYLSEPHQDNFFHPPEYLAVCCLEEALELRSNSVSTPILVLEGMLDERELPEFIEHCLIQVIHSHWQIKILQKKLNKQKSLQSWIKINTGMNRLGFLPNEIPQIYNLIKDIEGLEIIGFMTHFHSSEDIPKMQNQATSFFDSMAFIERVANPNNISSIDSLSVSLNATFGNMLLTSKWQNKWQEWTRLGIGLYIPPKHEIYTRKINNQIQTQKFDQALKLSSKIIAIQDVKQGQSVGYDASWIAEQDSRIAIVAGGYADGIPRSLSNVGKVSILGKKALITGKVSMDMFAVDISNIEQAKIGEEVEIWGETISIHEVAKSSKISASEIFTSLSSRVNRKYIS